MDHTGLIIRVHFLLAIDKAIYTRAKSPFKTSALISICTRQAVRNLLPLFLLPSDYHGRKIYDALFFSSITFTGHISFIYYEFNEATRHEAARRAEGGHKASF